MIIGEIVDFVHNVVIVVVAAADDFAAAGSFCDYLVCASLIVVQYSFFI
jgi:hypothetical protein